VVEIGVVVVDNEVVRNLAVHTVAARIVAADHRDLEVDSPEKGRRNIPDDRRAEEYRTAPDGEGCRRSS